MDKIIDTVSTIFKERYGTELKIEQNFKAQARKPVFLSHWQSPFVYSRTLRQVSFPIFNSRKELQAIAVAGPVENKDAIVFDEMAQFLQLTVAEHIEINEKLDLQVGKEMALERIKDENSNVVQLKTKKQKQPKSFEFKKVTPNKKPSNDPIWISGDNENFMAHIAFSAHDWIANWAFINAKEIPDLIWQDPNAWQNFPQVTIFIPNIEDLSPENLKTLETNLKNLPEDPEERPQIIVSSSNEVSDEFASLKRHFKYFKSNENVSPRAQAHFLLFHHKNDKSWVYECDKTNGVYFLPFTTTPNQFH